MEIVPCTDETGERASLAVYNAVYPLDAVTLEESRSFAASAAGSVDLVAVEAGETVGSGFAAVFAARPAVALALVTVLPGARGRGAGTALYRAVSRWGQSEGLEALEARIAVDDGASLAFAARRGFVEVERTSRFVLRLDDVGVPEVEAPDGLRIVTLASDPERFRGIYRVACEALPDIPGRGPGTIPPLEDWVERELRGPDDRPEATFVALAGNEVVGYAQLSLGGSASGRAGHAMTGVLRAWRGRGIGGALKRAQIRWAKENGLKELTTRNELRNEPIRRLNASLGYREAPGEARLRGPLAR